MGNCFGKPSSESESNNFGGTGRTVGTANATTPSTTARIPAKVKGPGRRLGDENSASTEDPKAAAARAAEVREINITGNPSEAKPMIATAWL